MEFELKDLVWLIVTVGSVVSVFFTLKQQVALLKQSLESEKNANQKELERLDNEIKSQGEKIDNHLKSIEEKLEKYFAKMEVQINEHQKELKEIFLKLAKIDNSS